ncbi:MAG: acyltransferase, partial [Salinibacterium sp.]|nr:acyltransferase [Salinibacterium sp.]
MSSDSAAGEPAGTRAPRPKRPELQALRALAVGVVILNHSWPGIAPGGYVGVDVFFVISGFLITQQLVSEARETSALKLGRFYAKRARRILPAATLVLLVCAMMTFVVVPFGQWGKFFTEITASALYVHNWVMVPELAGTSNSPVMHYWSLSVEEQFYLVWPLAILAA